jgi:hypothetical protein
VNKYIRKATALVISGLLTVTPLTAFAQTAIKINGVSQNISIEPIQQDGTTLVGLREFGKMFGAYIEWLPSSQETLIQKGEMKAVVKVGSQSATMNDQKVTLSVAPTIVNGNLMIGLDFLTQIFGVNINSDEQNNTIDITDGIEAKVLVVKPRNGINITYAEVLSKMTTANDDLKKIIENLETAIDNRKDDYEKAFVDGVVYDDPNSTDLSTLNSLLNQDINIKATKLNENLKKISIEYSTLSTLDSIINAEASIVLSEMNLEDAGNNLDITKKKYELGLVSKLEFDNAQTAYDKSVNTVKNSKESLASLYRSLNVMLDVNADTVYNINYIPKYVPTEITSLEGYINAKVAESAAVISAKYSIEQAENNMKLSLGSSYDSRKNSLAQAQRSLDNTKKDLTENMKNTYTAIKQLEKDYDLALVDLSDAKRDYELAKTQYNLGLLSHNELNKAKLNVASKEYNIQSILTKLVEKTFKFQNPDLL